MHDWARARSKDPCLGTSNFVLESWRLAWSCIVYPLLLTIALSN
jgi:hypothetical protein